MRFQVKSDKDWKDVESELFKSEYVKMFIDGYDIDIHVIERGLRKIIILIVDDDKKFEWLTKDCEQRRRFMRPTKSYKYTKASRDSAVRNRTVKWHKEVKRIDVFEKVTNYTPEWGSFRSLKKHLIANNKYIEYIPEFRQKIARHLLKTEMRMFGIDMEK